MTPDTVVVQPRNRFDRMEIAGAFGDLGTLIPFVVAYLAVLKMDPFGVLFAFGTGVLAIPVLIIGAVLGVAVYLAVLLATGELTPSHLRTARGYASNTFGRYQ